MVGFVIGPAQAHAPLMTQQEKRTFLIAHMEPKDYARHLVKKNWDNPDKEFKCLAYLWGKESAWNYRAKSPTHDYGIPQRHMSHNTPKQIRDFLSHPHPQIQWGLNYIKTRYDSPCGALKTWLSRGKNGKGGWY